jgi:NAD(P)-dependent dehydrogenase (short-subunit alcohol dehydrogenase family)
MAKGTYHVLMGARSVEKGDVALQQLRERNLPGSVEMLLLDVTKDHIIESAATKVRDDHGKLDILVNNAAVVPMQENGQLREFMRLAFDTNATGPLIVTNAFAPLLKESKDSPRIVNITSGAGSISCRLDRNSPTYQLQGHQYRASKSALHMITACQFVEYEPHGIKVSLYDPGFTQSNLGPHNKAEFGARKPVDSVMPLIDVLEGKRDDESLKILHNTGMYSW